MSSISDGDMPDVSPPRHSPKSPDSSPSAVTPAEDSDHPPATAGQDPTKSGTSDISDTDLPGSDRAVSAASNNVAEELSPAAAASASQSSGDEGNLEDLEAIKARLMAQLESDFHLSPESDSEGEVHSDDEDGSAVVESGESMVSPS